MSVEQIQNLKSSWPMPTVKRPIILIGAGGIVNDAHLPAYAKAGFAVAGIYDIDPSKAQALATKFDIPRVHRTLHDAAAAGGEQAAVFDVAVPPEVEFDVVSALPGGAAVLLQKPMGADLADARQIRDVCRGKRFAAAAVNFQFRFSPMMLAVADAMRQGLLGDVVDVEVRLNLRTPWELFPFLKKLR